MITLPSKVSRGDELTAAWANKVVDTLASLRPMAGEGTRVSQTPGGFIVSSSVPFQKKTLPFDIILSVDNSGGNQVQLLPGVVSGFLPSNIFEPIKVDLTQQTYVWLDVTSDAGAITGVNVRVGTENFTGQIPFAYAPGANFQIPAGVIIDGKPWNLLAKNWVNPVPVVAFTTYEGKTNTPVPHYIWNW
jgi:hypothetical protein